MQCNIWSQREGSSIPPVDPIFYTTRSCYIEQSLQPLVENRSEIQRIIHDSIGWIELRLKEKRGEFGDLKKRSGKLLVFGVREYELENRASAPKINH